MSKVASDMEGLSKDFRSKEDKKLRGVTKPNYEECNEKVAALRRLIQAANVKIGEIGRQIQERRSGQSAHTAERDELRAALDEVAQKQAELEKERALIVIGLDETMKTGRDMKSKVQTLKRNLGFQTEEQLEAQIRAVENQIQKKQMSVREENQIISHLKQLKSSRHLVGEYANMETTANNHANVAAVPLKARLEEVKTETAALQKKRRELSDKLRAIIQKNNETTLPVKDLAEQRDALRNEISEHRKQESELLKNLAQQNAEYKNELMIIKQKQYVKIQEERRLRQKDRQRKFLQRELQDIEDNAYYGSDYILAVQTRSYLRELIQSRRINAESSTSAAADEDSVSELASSLQGMLVMKPKADREEVFYVVPKKKKDQRKQKKPTSSEKTLISHNVSALADFQKQGLTPPMTLENCDAILAIVEQRIADMDAKVEVLKSHNDKNKAKVMAKLEALERDEDYAESDAAESDAAEETNDEEDKSGSESATKETDE